jgi:hypothetical protein
MDHLAFLGKTAPKVSAAFDPWAVVVHCCTHCVSGCWVLCVRWIATVHAEAVGVECRSLVGRRQAAIVVLAQQEMQMHCLGLMAVVSA